jgi:predicted ribosome quality control (RQC) complex YloA/Tae2 family protein
MSGALDQFYAAHERLTSHQQRKEALHAQLLEQRERLARQQRSLSTELERARDIDRLRWEGEMIFAFMHEIARGQQTLEVEGRTITLDPLRTPVECAQERFRAYEKARSAIAGLPERLAAVDLRIDGVDETIALLAIAEGYEEIETIAQEAIEEGFIPADGRRKQRGRGGVRPQSPLRLVSTDGVTIYVGRSAGQNQQVTFRLASSDDLWLHARGAPGAHVIVKSGGRPVPEQTLQEAAGLAAYFSHGRHEAAVDVDIARRSQVRRIRGGPQGLVSYHAEQSIRAAPRPPW